jgi:hypothetical protein
MPTITSGAQSGRAGFIVLNRYGTVQASSRTVQKHSEQVGRYTLLRRS